MSETLVDVVEATKGEKSHLESEIASNEPSPIPAEENPPKKITSRIWESLKKYEGLTSNWIEGWNPYDPAKLEGKGLKPVEIEESNIRKQSAKWFLWSFVIFFLWACFAPIGGGVTAQGTVSVLGNRKTVQHPTGGLVKEIMVAEGDKVEAGQILLRINPMKNDADLTTVELQFINLLATESRLKAERDGTGSIAWADELQKKFKLDDPRVLEAKKLQVQLLNSRRSEYNSQVSSLNEQVTSLTAVVAAKRDQQRSIKEEMVNANNLARDGFVPRSAANQAERQNSDIASAIASTLSDITRAKLQIAQLHSTYLKEIDTQLQEIQKNREALLLHMDSAKFDRDLAEVKAPVGGSVVGLKVFTIGGVVSPGAILMEIVPKDEKLIIEAKIPATAISQVKVDLETDLRFSTFNHDTTPVVTGKVLTVSADKMPGKGEGQDSEFYLAQIETTPESMKKLADMKIEIQPGLPVDVVIKTGERTFMSYMLKPLTNKFALAFKS